ncbi:beta-N-acetylhexosaminidase [Bacillus kwashiorkori]|uniref:beta-N-acetylhexosaminidase n=1 Tax=Bacillus kwashiorkori TaxID=1522318 RepID=UPI0007841F47|nr:beta-N-acetylhexosaminidase [Bacillus kwashiorkori]
MKLNIITKDEAIFDGIELLMDDLQIEVCLEGYPIEVTKNAGPIVVRNNGEKGEIHFEEPIHFFRALGLWLENYQIKREFDITETPQFTMSGVMLDASRNAVLHTNSVKTLLRKMAIMGLNVLMLYTEDTYEVKEYPYFGYMRGRYTEKELRELDLYADKLGIEMIPCIQTLAHLKEALKWNYAMNIRDTDDILLVGEPKTYEFIENMIVAASKPFKTKRIHIGMDEAFNLGLGNYLRKNGFEERFQIMNKHLQAVLKITEKHRLKPMIWSDMYFRLGSKTGAYYDLNAHIPENVIQEIPNVQLVYWDYYHTDEQFYETFIEKHKQIGPKPVFAGGVWTWNGISPNYGKAMATTEAALTACKKTGVQEVFATMWGDNGAETPLFTALPVLQQFAEHTYHKTVSDEQIVERFAFCHQSDMADFMELNKLDETPGVSQNNLHESNPSKLLLWQDVLIGLYDENIRGLSLNKHYQAVAEKLQQAKHKNNEWKPLFSFYEQLAHVLSLKAELGLQIKAAYDDNDKNKMSELVETVEQLKREVESLRKSHQNIWFSYNKPFGWEILDIRYGGVLTRLITTADRLNQWVNGEISQIEELAEERLPFEGPYPMPDGTIGRNVYHRIVTAGNLS